MYVVIIPSSKRNRDCGELLSISFLLDTGNFIAKGAYVTEQAQHLIVGSVVGNEEAEIGVSKHGSNSDKAGSAARHDADVLPSVLACFALTVVLIVKRGNSLSQWLDTGSGALSLM